MSDEIQLFDPESDQFEEYARRNGQTYWKASEFAKMLGYEGVQGIFKAVQKAMVACESLGIPQEDNIIPFTENGVRDYKLTRFACYLVAINGDVRKPAVARAQAYFITMAEVLLRHVQQSDGVERLVVRHEMSGHEKSLAGVANQRGLDNYAFFQNAGYRGMYNMNISQLKVLKGVPTTRSPLDFMGRDELAANLFRLTQTEAKIKKDDITGQGRLEAAATTVGRKVREFMLENSGQTPEELPPSGDLREVGKSLKGAQRHFKKLDK